MKTIKQITELIYNELDYAYCDNCRGNDTEFRKDNEDYCEDCHRKYQSWAISENTAKAIAKKILSLKGEK